MPLVATAAAASASGHADAFPQSLQQLISDMEASDNRTVSTHLARKAKDLIADAISGSMCEKKLGRRIPLAEALQHSRVELTAAVNEYRDDFVKNPFRAMSGVDSTRVISKQLVEVSLLPSRIVFFTNSLPKYRTRSYIRIISS